MLDHVLSAFGFPGNASVTPHGSGLINRTWFVRNGKDTFILQQINHDVFTHPEYIDANIQMVGQYLAEHYPGITFPRPVTSVDGKTLVTVDDNYYRLYPFIENSVTIDVAHSPAQAFEAARQFGGFTRRLSDFPAQRLHETLPDFHNLSLRYRAFEDALKNGLPERIEKSEPLIACLNSQHHLVTRYENILADPGFKRRVTHHDTKISNVLFDKQGHGICVIDLDTVMPGYFISDVGDMLRTYVCPVSEEEGDMSLIHVRLEYFEAIVQGYLHEMAGILTAVEKQAFGYAGEFMIYMQALRFLTDHLIGDRYYGSRYQGHNYIRALNQVTLLQHFQEAMMTHSP
ncbi:MAG TPA: aminoglycoside phosphotransferase family protein [Puia sp.]|nr:aminoglycoside phosphotransferase family protein [Puia sp.]